MAEEDFEIEYLDEDEDLVQQCVGTSTGTVYQPEAANNTEDLLVKRQPKKKRKYESDDNDYMPEDDRKKPATQPDKAVEGKTYTGNKAVERKIYTGNKADERKTYPGQKKKLTYTPLNNDILSQRKLLKVRIPDYDDPLCLPVQTIITCDSDQKKLNNWNRMCLEQLRFSDKMFRPNTREESVSSTKTIIFKTVNNRKTGKPDISVLSKTTCQSESGESKSAVFQCTLPRFKGNTSTRTYNLLPNKLQSLLPHVDEAILTKEVVNEEETLVVYKPKDFVSAVYMFEENEDDSNDNLRRLRELSVCKMCVLCYQTSWRGSRKNEKRTIECVICNRSQVSVYSLLTHLKTHPANKVREHKKQISRLLASIVDYHYKCRICLKMCNSIKVLKKHVPTHKGVNMFHCEVGSHHTM